MPSDLPAISDLFRAYFECRKTKRNTIHALDFEFNLERNIITLYNELIDGSYKVGRSKVFIVTHPKVREIWASDFRDRIVHHLIYNKISERFYKSFIFDSYACIPGKGTHKAVDRAEHFARSITANRSKEAYVLKMDIANFFVGINKNILCDLTLSRMSDLSDWWKDLVRHIIYTNPSDNPVIASNEHLLNLVPYRKSLFNAQSHKGLPIGSLHSQFSANIVLNRLDQYAKRSLGLKRYIRYVDDILVLGETADELKDLPEIFDTFLRDELDLRLHPNKTYLNKVSLGFDFLGYRINPWSRYIRRSAVAHGVSSVYRAVNDYKSEKCPHSQKDRLKYIYRVANSYFNILNHANNFAAECHIANVLESEGLSEFIPSRIRSQK